MAPRAWQRGRQHICRPAVYGFAATGGVAALPGLQHRLCCTGTALCMHACSQHAGIDHLLGTPRKGAATFAQARPPCHARPHDWRSKAGAACLAARRRGSVRRLQARQVPRCPPHAPPPAPARAARSGQRLSAPPPQRRRSGRPAAAMGGTPCAQPPAPPDPQAFAVGRGRSCGRAGAGTARPDRAEPTLVTVRALVDAACLTMNAWRPGAGGGGGGPVGAPPHSHRHETAWLRHAPP